MTETITVTLNGEPKEILMSMGLLNELSAKLGDVDAIPELSVNAELRESIMISALADRDNRGKLVDPEINLFSLDISTEDTLRLLDWVGEHVADFFLKSMAQTKSLFEDRQVQFRSLMPTSPGGED
jgi:hypothetical protein